MSKRFIIIGAVVLGLCGFLVWWNHARDAGGGGFAFPPIAVEAITAETVTWKPAIEAVGTTRAQSGADLAVEAAGVVRAISFAPGDKATLGQLLVQIDDAAEQADMASAQANIKINKQQLDRVTALRKKGYAAQATWDDAKAKLDVAQSIYDRAASDAARKAIKAPFDGTLGIAQVNVGQFAGVGTTVVTLQDLDKLKVDFTVPEQTASALHIGQEVRFGTEPDSLPYTGTLNGIDPKVDPATHLVAVQALLDNQDHRVLPGQFLRVRVDLGEQPGILAVPQTAVVTSLYGDYVYLIVKEDAGGKESLTAKQTFVKTGRRDLGSIEITSGLKVGDMIVSVGQNKLQNGAHVMLPPQVSEAGGSG